ncbi:MAG: rhomboid family intramembrane serine protease [Pyrinomonadaceae bacterium MAG19_C2-C3]|nr:rhomboid family intramembrane serine protease [Pyrinomonadaceae bacterium MAG19_C2-C3]
MTNPTYTNRPSVCRNCGALIGAGEKSCAMCDAPKGANATNNPPHNIPNNDARDADGVARPRADHETMRFAQTLFQRPVTFTFIFLFLNVIVFLLTTWAGGSQNNLVLIAFGAKFNALINEGQWWRFVAPIFLHGGVPHLLMNMYGLWILGPYVERLYGSAKFVVFWIVSGIMGVVASYLSVQPDLHSSGIAGQFLFKAQDAVSVGASGALFGLIGVLFVFGIKYRHELPDGFKQAFGTGMLPTILLNVFIGFIIPVIDNAAHLGGLFAGAVLATGIDYKRVGTRGSVAYLWHGLQAIALALVVLTFAIVGMQLRTVNFNAVELGTRIVNGLSVSPANDFVAYFNMLNEASNVFTEALSGDTSRVAAALEEIERAPDFGEEEATVRAGLISLLNRARDFGDLPESERANRVGRTNATQLIEDFNAWQQQRLQWFQDNGARFGIPPIPQNPNQTSPTANTANEANSADDANNNQR